MFRAAMPLSYIPKAFLFIGINVTDFLERFEDMATDCGLSDDCKVRRVQKYCEFGITQCI